VMSPNPNNLHSNTWPNEVLITFALVADLIVLDHFLD
jgi:hypothetical protein